MEKELLLKDKIKLKFNIDLNVLNVALTMDIKHFFLAEKYHLMLLFIFFMMLL
jgi:hypothetical protein